MPSGLEIQRALRAFVRRWRAYAGSERGEAQTYLNQLFECYGTDRLGAGARFEDAHASVGIMDLYWPDVCIVEMKAPSRAAKLAEHRKQALDYWRESSDVDRGIEAPTYVVLCAFQRFEVWMPGRFPTRPVAEFVLDELPDRYDALMFLAGVGIQASYLDHHRTLTTEATQTVTDLYHRLADRSAAPVDELHRFTLQSVWCLFAEDLGMLDGYPLQTIVSGLRKDSTRSSYAELGALYEVLNQKGNRNRLGALKGTRYVNGELFARPAKLHLESAELDLIAKAAEFDWRKVNPTIFGSLLEGVLGNAAASWAPTTHTRSTFSRLSSRRSSGRGPRGSATPRPRPRRGHCSTSSAGSGCSTQPAAAGTSSTLPIESCAHSNTISRPGSGRWRPGRASRNLPARGPTYHIERVAVLIARVTLWMGHRQMIDLYGEAEPPLPLVDLSGVRVADALRVPWPETDAIVGNPPFLGSQLIRGAMGDDYVDWLSRTFGVGVKDYCVYWFRRAHDHLRPGQRAGLVGTNSVAQNRARSVSLEYVVGHGGVITDAVSSQKWPGEAKVHVALVNWVKEPESPPAGFRLNGAPVPEITAELKPPGLSASAALPLPANAGRCFQGPIPVGGGFILNEETAQWLLGRSEAAYADVVRRYLVSEDLADRPDQAPSRWIIDFASLPLEVAMRYPAALDIVRSLVRPERETNAREGYRRYWWRLGEHRPGLRRALSDGRLSRYAVVGRLAKRLNFAWQDVLVCPSDLVYVFALDDDYSMGILMSRAHGAWARARGSSFKADPRYTPTSVFMTFPWPYPVPPAKREQIAAGAVALLVRRSEICQDRQIGLTALYNDIEDGAHQDLKRLHARLDEAVAGCYGWPKPVAQDDADLVRRLVARNIAIADGSRAYQPFPVRA